MLHDLTLAFRRLRNAPAFAAASVVTLSLAIGANTAIFSVADPVLFKPLPYADPDRVYVLMTLDPKTGQRLRSVPLTFLQAIDEHHGGLGEVGFRGPTTFRNHASGDETELIENVAMTPEYLRVLGVRPIRGRLFEAADAMQPGRSAVISYESWHRRFGGDEGVIGRSMLLGGETREIVGVLPAGFVLPTTALNFLYSRTGRPEFFTVAPLLPSETNPDGFGLVVKGLADEAVVRLERGTTLEQAQAEIESLIAPLRGDRTDVVVLENPRAVLFPTGRPIMALLVAAAALVLLIGCANLANMLLARTRGRERELGLYAALGATRFRIIRPIFFETLIVGAAAALLALFLTALAFDLLLQQVPPVVYGAASIRLDLRVAVFALMLGVVSGIVFAVVPAWQATRADVLSLVRGTNIALRGRGGVFGHPMVSVQVALAIVLVFGAAIAGQAFVSVLNVPIGFSPDNLLVINASPNPSTTSLREFYTSAIEALDARGDVLAAGAGASVPTDGFGRSEAVDRSSTEQPVDLLHVLPGYLETIGMPLVRGRRLIWADLPDGSSAVLSDAAARALFPNQEALGGAFRTREGRQFTVVGVVADVPRSLSRRMDPVAYALPPLTVTRGMTIVARMSSRGPAALVNVRREIVRLARGTPVTSVWWTDVIDGLTVYRNPRFQSLLLGTFAALALVLTALGIFGVVAIAVAARTREMGVRLAIGAPPRSLIQLVVRQALTPVVFGVLVGLLATQWLRPILEAQLYEVNARDPVTLAAAAVTVVAAALLASYLPARRACRVDPIAVLRAE